MATIWGLVESFVIPEPHRVLITKGDQARRELAGGLLARHSLLYMAQ